MEKNKKYQCKKCHWRGSADQLIKDTVETCFGNDTIDICPACGDYQVLEIMENTSDNIF